MSQVANEEFFQKILREHEGDDSITVSKVEKSPACDKGDSFVSLVSKVKVSGKDKNGADYERQLIIKELPPAEQRAIYRSEMAMRKEMVAYNKIVPLLQAHADGPLPLAECVYADEKVVVLQDLTATGYNTMKRSSGGLTVEQCEIVLKGLARLHAASFVFKQKEPEKFKEISGQLKEILFEGGDSMLLDSQAGILDNTVQVFQKMPSSDDLTKAVDLLKDLRANSRTIIKQLLLNPREHAVICHGDPWVMNALFSEKNELKLVDLQLMRANSIASDLAYLFYVNLPSQVRLSNMERLLDLYLQDLQDHIKAKGVTVDILSKEWLKKEMEAFNMYGLVYGLWIMPAFFMKDEDVMITEQRLKEAFDVASKSGPQYEERMRDMVVDFVKHVQKQ